MSESQLEFTVSTPKKEDGTWITDGAWISGAAGVITLLTIAIICQKNRWLDNGVSFFDLIELETSLEVKLFCLIVVAILMCVTEIVRLSVGGHKKLFVLAPELTQGRYFSLIMTCVWRYICYLVLFYLAVFIYKVAPEYGFIDNSAYYQPWFKMCQWLLTAYIWLGFPYVLLTYSLKYDAEKDKNSYHQLVETAVISALSGLKLIQKPSTVNVSRAQLKKISLGLLVRLFFVPLMTVFFIDQFGRLVSNFGYMTEFLPKKIMDGNYSHAMLNQDMMNIMKPIIFSIDVSIAWCGYTLTSRWIDNETQSTEPTILGWCVCLISYPPFQLAALYFIFPAESKMLSLDNQYFVTFFTVLLLLSFIIYTLATIVFGVRFSNLTHRGIIRTGPFSIIRHPAYTSKNISWWLGIFPVVLYLYFTGATPFIYAFLSIVGLMAQSYWYYLRAMTEEKHLMVDPTYQEYCKVVKYRFIPGVI